MQQEKGTSRKDKTTEDRYPTDAGWELGGKGESAFKSKLQDIPCASLNKLGPSLPVCELPFDKANLKLSIPVLLRVSYCCFFSLAEVYC